MIDTEAGRKAGAAQAIPLLTTIQLPVVPIMALAPNLPLLFRHFADTPGKEFLIPMIITLPSLGIVLLGPVAGLLADRWGRRRLMLWALALFAIAGCAPVFLDDLRAILGAQVLLGVAEAVIITNCNTLLGDYFEEAERNRWLGIQSIIGPVFAATALTAVAFYVPAIHFSLVLDKLGAHSSGLLSVLATVATIGSVASGYYFHSQQKNPEWYFPLIYLCFGVGFIGLGLSPNYWVALVFGIIINYGFGLTLPSLIGLALRRLPPDYRGRGMGMWMSAFFCAQFLSPPIFALVMRGVGGVMPGFVAAGVTCMVIAVGRVVARSAPSAAAA